MASLWRMRSKCICKIDVTAFAAVLIVLVCVMWIYDLMFLPSNADWRLLPNAKHPTSMPDALKEDAIRVAVLSDGMVFFGDNQWSMQKTSIGELQHQVREKIVRGSEKKVYIEVDHRARYLVLTPVLEAIRNSGIQEIAFIVQETKPQRQ